ncbi:MAG TPA: hypothetical protein VF578_02915 [Methylomirabilota bacterium]
MKTGAMWFTELCTMTISNETGSRRSQIGGAESAVHRPDERVGPHAQGVIAVAHGRRLAGAQVVHREAGQALEEAHPLPHSMPRLLR